MTAAPPEPTEITVCGLPRAGAHAMLVGEQLTRAESVGDALLALGEAAPEPR